MYEFDAGKTVAVIRSWPNNMATLDLSSWLNWIGVSSDRFRPHWNDERDMVCAYNFGIKHQALRTNAEQFIFADNDIRPHPQKTAPFLTLTDDVVACEYETENSHRTAWPNGHAFHTGLWRCHRAVLERVEPPWFEPRYKDDGCEWAACLCESFAKKVTAAGFTIAHGGWAGHTPRRIRGTR